IKSRVRYPTPRVVPLGPNGGVEMLRANGIEHHVEDFDGEVAFFRGVLECPGTMYVANAVAGFMVADNLPVLVLPRDPEHPPYSNLKAITLDITVELDQVDARYEALKAKGVVVRQPPITQPMGVRTFYFETPGGL